MSAILSGGTKTLANTSKLSSARALKQAFSRISTSLLSIVVLQLVICSFAFQLDFFRADAQTFKQLFSYMWLGNLVFLGLLYYGLRKQIAKHRLLLGLILWAGTGILITAYYVDSVRLCVMVLYFATLQMGCFHLTRAEFAVAALFGAAGYAMVNIVIYIQHPESIDLSGEMVQWGAFTLLIAGFAILGGEIGRIRIAFNNRNAELSKALDRVSELAIKDDLTGLYNRRYIMDVMRQQQALADRGVYNYVICFVDLDHFKQINDVHGHSIGDVVLQRFSSIAEDRLSPIDYCARFGGEEFVLVLTKADLEKAMLVAEDVRVAVSDIDFDDIAKDLNVTVSVGVAECRVGEAVEAVLSRADGALYEAKENGRNQVLVG